MSHSKEQFYGSFDVENLFNTFDKFYKHLGTTSLTILGYLLNSYHWYLSSISKFRELSQKFVLSRIEETHRSLFNSANKNSKELELESTLHKILALYTDNSYRNSVISHFKGFETVPSNLVSSYATYIMLNDSDGSKFQEVFQYGKNHKDQTVKQAIYSALGHCAHHETRQKLFEMCLTVIIHYLLIF